MFLYVFVVYYEVIFGLIIVGLFNFLFDFKMYGCIFIDLFFFVMVVLLFYNFKVVWVLVKSGDKFLIDFVVVGSVGWNFDLYFGCMEYGDGIVMLCVVISFGKCGKWVVMKVKKVIFLGILVLNWFELIVVMLFY